MTKALLLTVLLIVFTIYFEGPVGIPFYVGIGVTGALLEAFCIMFCDKIWNYKHPDLFGIPFWLIPLWSVVAIVIVELYKAYFRVTDSLDIKEMFGLE
jgi:hypothetical protein